MTVASLELCRELYELSGWEQTSYRWFYEDGVHSAHPIQSDRLDPLGPAYDLGFMLRKLPKPAGVSQMLSRDEVWIATSGGFHPNKHPYLGADTPEDAVAKLCCELIKQEVL